MSSQELTVAFELSEGERLRAAEEVLAPMDVMTYARLAYLIGFLVGPAIGALLASLGGIAVGGEGPASSAALRYVVGMVLCSLVWTAIWPALARRIGRGLLGILVGRGAGGRAAQPTELTVSDEGIFVRQAADERRVTWEGVRGIQGTDSFVFLVLANSAVAIPRRAFARPDEWEAFVQTVRARAGRKPLVPAPGERDAGRVLSRLAAKVWRRAILPGLVWLVAACLLGVLLNAFVTRQSAVDVGEPVPPGQKAGVTAADLRSEITVPHLWATVESLSFGRKGLRATMRVERAGGLEATARVSRFALNHTVWGAALQDADGRPVLLNWPFQATVSPPPWDRDYLPVPDGGVDILSTSRHQEASLGWRPSPTRRQTTPPKGAWIRYYLSTDVSCLTADLKRSSVPLMGGGMVQFGGAEAADGGEAMPDAAETTDLRSDVEVPHLWTTVRLTQPDEGKAGLVLHLEPAATFNGLRVSKSDLTKAALRILLRTRDGCPVVFRRSAGFSDGLAPAADSDDYVAVPADGVDVADASPGDLLYYFESMGSTYGPVPLPEGVTIRYYVCNEVECRVAGREKPLHLPLLGVGLAEYGGAGE